MGLFDEIMDGANDFAEYMLFMDMLEEEEKKDTSFLDDDDPDLGPDPGKYPDYDDDETDYDSDDYGDF